MGTSTLVTKTVSGTTVTQPQMTQARCLTSQHVLGVTAHWEGGRGVVVSSLQPVTLQHGTQLVSILAYTPELWGENKHCLLVGCLTYQQQASVSQGRICSFLPVLPHRDRSWRSNCLPHPVTVYWHRANQSHCSPYNARCLAG